MAAAICAEDDAPLAAAECAGGGIEKPDLVDAKAGALKRSVYLMDCAPVWGSASTRGLSAEMEDACAAAPRFADVPVCLLASRRDLDGLGIDAGELRLPAHPVAVYDGHGRPEVANYCRERLHVLLSIELRLLGKDSGEMGEVDMKVHWDEMFSKCLQRVDDEVSGRASIGGVEERQPVAPENVGLTAVVAVVSPLIWLLPTVAIHVLCSAAGRSRCHCQLIISLTGWMSEQELKPREARSSNGMVTRCPVYLSSNI